MNNSRGHRKGDPMDFPSGSGTYHEDLARYLRIRLSKAVTVQIVGKGPGFAIMQKTLAGDLPLSGMSIGFAKDLVASGLMKQNEDPMISRLVAYYRERNI